MKMIHSPVDKSLIIFLGNEGFSWYIEGCGENIRALFQGRPINEYIFHPTERNWGLASAYSLCEDYVGEPCRIVKELYVTQNLGDDWKILGDYINQFAWGVLNEDMIKAGVPKERIIVTYQPKGRGHQKDTGKWNYKIDLVYSDDFFKTKIVGNRKGNREDRRRRERWYDCRLRLQHGTFVKCRILRHCPQGLGRARVHVHIQCNGRDRRKNS